jgi:hypothetical protein
LEHLDIDDKRLKQLGASGFMPPLDTSCADHEGSGLVRFQRWDGERWTIITDWMASRCWRTASSCVISTSTRRCSTPKRRASCRAGVPAMPPEAAMFQFAKGNPMKLKPIFCFMVTLACFSADASMAQDKAVAASDAAKRPAPKSIFVSLDDNGDGVITRTEASERTQLLVDFDRIDLDLDDKLEPTEYASFYSAGYRGSK